MKTIYLDNQSTTKVDPIVIDEMLPYLNEKYGNASSKTHVLGWESNEAIIIAKERIANLINAKYDEIYFTSGATESINIALKSTKPNHIITLNTEHTVTLDICEYLKSKSCDITYISVPNNGIISLDHIRKYIKAETSLISIMHAHNEIGVIQPIKEIGQLCKDNGILLHVDAAQSAGKIPIDVVKMNIDLLSISSHKMYGPKGMGALFIKRKQPRIAVSPLFHGGGQQNGIRPGTLPVHIIVGFGKACEISQENMGAESNNLLKLREHLYKRIIKDVTNVKINGDLVKRLPGNLNITFNGNQSEKIIMKLRNIALSNGSACTSNSTKPSYVLKAIGRDDNEAHSSVRFSIGRFNTIEEIDYTVDKILTILKNREG